MLQASTTGYIATDNAPRSFVHIRADVRLFWVLCVVQGFVLLGLVLWVMSTLPALAPLAATSDYETVQTAIIDRVNGTVNDPVITIRSGVTARSSNVRGLSLNGAVYYYSLEGQKSFDPLSRGLVTRSEVDVVVRDTSGPQPLLIYRIK